MIAYNHYINFIPEFRNQKKMKDTFFNVITVRENLCADSDKKLQYNMTFPDSQGRSLTLYSNFEFLDTNAEKNWAFEIKNVFTLFWSIGTMELQYIKHSDFSEDLLKYWLLHVILPTFFIIEGIYDFLHAGAVEINQEPVLFIAKSFGGKSTVTDYFIKQGHTMISDDKVATIEINNDFYAIPSYPYHRPYRNIEDLGFFVKNFSKTPKVLHLIYTLEAVENHQDVAITPLTGIDKFKALRDAKEMNLFFPESLQLDYLGKIAQKVSVFKVQVPWNLNRLNEVYHAITQHHSIFKDM